MSDEDVRRLCTERLNAVPDWLFETDTQGVVTYSNSVVQSLLGWRHDDVVGRPIYDWVADADKDKLRRLFESLQTPAFTNGITIINFRDSSGSAKPLALTCAPVSADSSLAEGFRVFCRDAGSVDTMHSTASEVSENYKSVLENSQIGLVIVQGEKAVYANPKIMQMLGYKPEDAAGQSIWRFIHPDDAQGAKENYRRRLAGESVPSEYEIRVLTKSGEVRHLELRATVITFRGTPAVLDSVVDITERKRSEEILRASEERFRILFERSPDIVFMLKKSRFVEVNPAIESVLGYEPKEVLGKAPWVISPETQPDGVNSRDKAKEYIAQALKHGPQTFDWVHQAKDGSLVDFSVSLVAYKLHGETCIQAIVRDITERKQAEARRRALERQMEAQKRHFYRDTILSVTNGKLDVCDYSEVKPYLSTAQFKTEVADSSQVSRVRKEISEFCRNSGLEGERLETFMIGVGEAIANAIKHAEGGRIFAGARDGSVWVAVADKGPGINSLILPRVALVRGFSTKPSLGLGYSIMLEVCDRILLKTGDRGTIVVLVRSLVQPEEEPAHAVLADTWNSIPS